MSWACSRGWALDPVKLNVVDYVVKPSWSDLRQLLDPFTILPSDSRTARSSGDLTEVSTLKQRWRTIIVCDERFAGNTAHKSDHARFTYCVRRRATSHVLFRSIELSSIRAGRRVFLSASFRIMARQYSRLPYCIQNWLLRTTAVSRGVVQRHAASRVVWVWTAERSVTLPRTVSKPVLNQVRWCDVQNDSTFDHPIDSHVSHPYDRLE